LGLHALMPGSVEASYEEVNGQSRLGLKRTWGGEDGEAMVHRSLWVLDETGVRVDEEITVPPAWEDVPRVGVRFDVSKTLTRLEWLGLGPDETYPDRYQGQTFGNWWTISIIPMCARRNMVRMSKRRGFALVMGQGRDLR